MVVWNLNIHSMVTWCYIDKWKTLYLSNKTGWYKSTIFCRKFGMRWNKADNLMLGCDWRWGTKKSPTFAMFHWQTNGVGGNQPNFEKQLSNHRHDSMVYNITARRCVLPGDLQGRSRQFPACLFETSEWERSVNMLRQFPLSRVEPTALVVLPIRSCYFCPNQSTFKIHWCYLTELINFMELPLYIYIYFREGGRF